MGISSWRDAGDGSLMSDAKELSAEVEADYADYATSEDRVDVPKPRSLSSAATKIAPSNTTL
ncbi:hypothetical protein R0J93_27655, partial [Pseudoalteromonas sp. SIMBA_148]